MSNCNSNNSKRLIINDAFVKRVMNKIAAINDYIEDYNTYDEINDYYNKNGTYDGIEEYLAERKCD